MFSSTRAGRAAAICAALLAAGAALGAGAMMAKKLPKGDGPQEGGDEKTK